MRTQGIRALPGSFETAANVLSSIANAASAGRPLDWSATLAGRYRALSLAEARAAAAEIVKADELVWVVVGDRAKIEAGAARAQHRAARDLGRGRAAGELKSARRRRPRPGLRDRPRLTRR